MAYMHFIPASICRFHAVRSSSVCIMILVLAGCNRPGVESLPENTGMMPKLCQLKRDVAIGFNSGPNLVLIDACAGDANNSLDFRKLLDKPATEYSYLANRSPDGKWLAWTSGHELQLQGPDTSSSRVAVKAEKFLTPPRWSPDSKFLFIGTSENRSKARSLSQCVDDISEIYVVEAAAGNGTIVGRACVGVPIDAFRWLRF